MTILLISPDLHLGPTLVPNRTGMRETESTVGRSSIQVCCHMRIMLSVLLLMLHISVQVREDQEELLAQQDAGLDMLHDIVVRQKGMGQQIFREVAAISKTAIHQLSYR